MDRRKTLSAIGAIVVAGIAAWQGGGVDSFLSSGNQRGKSSNSHQTSDKAGKFDYFVLTLSWSPSFCEASNRKSEQCDSGRPYGFVAHGLWPQFEKGWPENCDIRARVPDSTVRDMLPIMPAKGLIFHQWKKHGTCSGMQPREYFQTVREAYDAVQIPKPLKRLKKTITVDPRVIEDAFLESNPSLKADEIVISCSHKRLHEVRICFDKDLEFRRCGKDVHRECRDKSIRMPPVRGG